MLQLPPLKPTSPLCLYVHYCSGHKGLDILSDSAWWLLLKCCVVLQAALIKQLGAEATECLKGFWSAASPTAVPDMQQHLASTNQQQQQQAGSHPQQQQQQGQSRLAALTTALLLNYMPLTVRELGEWEVDAEAFYHAMDNSTNWQDSLRGCAQHLLLVLLTVRVSLLVESMHLLMGAEPSAQSLGGVLMASATLSIGPFAFISCPIEEKPA
jgi:hypothetical protein